MAYIGRNPAIGTQKVLDSLESQFNGVLTTFDLRYNTNTIYPTIASALIVSLGGVLQEPGSAYNVASDQITFATAPPTGADCWILLYSEFGGAAGATTNLTIGNSLTVQGDTDLDGDIDIDAGQITYTASSNIAKFADDAKLIFGTGDDLQIYHDGSNSYIENTTGSLYIRDNGNNIYIQGKSGESSGIFRGNGAVELYYDNSKKIETTSTGVTVTGTALATDLSTGASGTGINISTNTISGPATLTLDPAGVGDNTGTVIIAGGLQVDGTTTTINSTTLTVDDKNIVLASGAANAAAADGAGITVDGAAATLLYNATPDAWSFNKNVGIGTNAPSAPLHISGAGASTALIKIEDNDNGFAASEIGVENGGRDLKIAAPQDIYFEDISTGVRHVYIENGGNVGIGTDDPDTSLEVKSLGATGISSKSSSTQATDTNKALKVRNNSTTDTFNVSYKGQGYFAGNVGIGTDNPQQLLDIASAAPNIRFTDTADGYSEIDGNSAELKFNADKGNAKADSKITFFVDNTEKVRITSGFGGNLLVGMETVYNVNATAHFRNGINIVAEDENGDVTQVSLAGEPVGRILFGDTRPGKYAEINCIADGVCGTNDYPGRLVFRTTPDGGSNTVERMRIGSDGNVGIAGNLAVGTTSPSHSLHVEGDIRAQDGALILSYADGGNIDHLWHDDTTEYGTPGSFVFNSDTSYKSSTGGTWSNIKVGHVYVDNGNLGTTVGNIQDLARFYANNGNATSIRIQAKRKVAGANWQSAGYKIFCHTDSIEQGYIEFNPHTTTANDGSYDVAIGSTAGEIVRFGNSGNVGIGTNNPLTKLEVVGDITIDNGGQKNAIRTNAAGQLQFLRNAATNNTVTVTIDDETGNVGIGTDNPGALLHIAAAGANDRTAYLTKAADTNFRLTAANGSGTNANGQETARFGMNYASTNAWGEYIKFSRGGGSADGAMGFYTGNAESIHIKMGGNVGIGTNNPRGKLHVEGGNSYAYFKTNTDGVAPVNSIPGLAIGWNKISGSRHVNFVCNSGQAAINGNGGFQFSTQTNTGTFQDQIMIKGDGNVGIGTNSPAYKLEVEGDIKVGEQGTLWFSDAANSIEKIVNTAGTLNLFADSDIHFYESDANVRKFTIDVNDGQLDLGSNLATTTAEIHFDYHATSYINGSLFGLGTTDPASNLQVEYGTGTNASTTIRIGTTNDLNTDKIYSLGWGDPATTQMGMGPYSTSKSVFGSRHGLAIHVHGDDEFSVRSSGWNELFAVEGGTGRGYFQGNVGIGTNNPTQKLEVKGGSIFIRDDNYLVTNRIRCGDGNQELILTAGESYAYIGQSPSSQYPPAMGGENVYLVAESGLVVYSSSGNWVNSGAVRRTGTFCDSSGNGSLPGTLSEGSDARLKTNIQTIPNALEKVKSLRGAIFNRVDKDNKEEIGLIAQEVEEVLPQVVEESEYTWEDKNMKSIGYGKMVGLLVEAIKEQQELIGELQQRLDDAGL